MVYQARHVKRYGLRLADASYDWEQVQSHVRQVITTIRGGTSEEASAKLEKQGITVITGEARCVSTHDVRVGEQTLSGERLIIAAGCQTLVPEVEGLQEAGFITNVEAVSLAHLPRRLAVIGGGPIGVEFAQLFHRFGVDVTVIEKGAGILDKDDRELAEMLCGMLIQEGIRIETGAELTKVQRTEQGKTLTYQREGEATRELVVDEILVALGRRPALETLNLEAIGVKTTKKGIQVDEMLRTSVPHIWAAGDIATPYQFTHVAYEQGKLAAQNAFAEQPQPFRVLIPWVTYTQPTLAHVGQTEEELRSAGRAYHVGRMKFNDVERAVANGHTEGLVKLLVGTDGRILGGHILGVGADDLLAPLIVAMNASMTAKELATNMFPYPTLSEAVRWAADRVEQ